jgi:hypothetical protein
MAGYRRTLAAAAAGLAAAGAIATAVVMTAHPGSQVAQAAANAQTSPVLGRPSAGPEAFLARLHTVHTIASTVPGNGDVNPYGIAVIQHSAGRLHAGDILVSNFNDKANLQGTGSTIEEITPAGTMRVFAQITTAMLPGSCPGGIGLSTALAILPDGWVAVGSAPSSNGQVATAKAGCVILLNDLGQVRETLAGAGINGPWDATVVSHGNLANLLVTNAFNGTAADKGKIVRKGTVVRITLLLSATRVPRVLGATTVASGLAERASSAAFVLGPAGVAVSFSGILYIADTATNTITAVPDALTRHTSAGLGLPVSNGGALSQPLGLAIAPNGNILTVNGGNGKIIETIPTTGYQVGATFLDTSGSPAGAGALFGLAITPSGTIYYTDDAANDLRLLNY